MRTISKKSKIIIAGVAAATLGTSGVAYAYWTTGGSGTGSAATSAGSTNQLILVDASTVTPSNMAPGVTTGGGISVVVKNNHATESYHVASVTASFASVDPVTGPNIDATHPCDTSDYDLNTPIMTNGAIDLVHGTTAAFSGASLYFHNKGTNQDGCKGATVHLSFAIA